MVNIGAGFDTLFWRLRSTGDDPLRFVELDFSEVTAKKTHYIQRAKPLLQAISHDGTAVYMCTLFYVPYTILFSVANVFHSPGVSELILGVG